MTEDQMLAQYRGRVGDFISTAFHQRRVVAVGAGAGSYMLEKLARLAIGEVRVVDPDIVEWANLARTAYRKADVGRPKVDALEELISAACPLVRVQKWAWRLEDLSATECNGLFAEADLLIAGTDHFPTQARLNRESQARAIPAVFIGIHAGAKGGRIIWSVPGETACYRCVARETYEAFASDGPDATDLPGAHGCLPDIQCIDMIALKVILAILERNENSMHSAFYQAMRGRSEIIVRNWPDYEFGNAMWEAVLSDLPRQPREFAEELKQDVLLSHDTMWLRTSPHPDCPDCSSAEER